jgi:hypothetical protein
MDMPVAADEKTETGWKLTATASERTIEIEFERLTERTTRMRVVANEGISFKDASTATEIITQTAQTHQDDRAVRTTEPQRKRSAS